VSDDFVDYDESDYPPYKYEDLREQGYTRTTKRTWFHVIYTYNKDDHYVQDKHPNLLHKAINTAFSPIAVLLHGAPEVAHDLWRHWFDKRYGSYTSTGWWTRNDD